MKKMILLFSHILSDKQIEDAKHFYNVDTFLYLPKDLQTKWSNFDPDAQTLDLSLFKKHISHNTKSGDLVLIQGDFGASYEMVNFCKTLKLTTLYATTKRSVVEIKDNDENIEKKSIFEFRRFREYGI